MSDDVPRCASCECTGTQCLALMPIEDGMFICEDCDARIRAGRQSDLFFAYTCGAVEAGKMIVQCDCGLVRQSDRAHGHVADVQLRGWNCRSCRVFNGEEKERLTSCRSCGSARP